MVPPGSRRGQADVHTNAHDRASTDGRKWYDHCACDGARHVAALTAGLWFLDATDVYDSRLRRAFAALSVCVVLGASPVRAQDSKTEAQKLFEAGEKAEDAGDCAEAADKFERAAEIVETPQLRLRAGRCQERIGKLARAERNILRGIELAKDDAALKKYGDELMAKLKGRIPTLVFQIEPSPPPEDLSIMIDGIPGLVDKPNRIDPGRHRIEARARGFEESIQVVSVAEGVTDVVKIKLSPATARPPGETPDPPEEPSKPTKYGPIPWILLGGGAAALGGAIGSGVAFSGARSKYDDLVDTTGCRLPDGGVLCPPELQGTDAVEPLESAASEANLFLGLTVAFSALGAGLITTGIVLAANNEELPVEATLVPWLGPGIGGASLLGSF
jgi:hypothetical protein